MNIKQMMQSSEKFFRDINDFLSQGDLALLDVLYPERNGIADADAMADLMLLRDRINGIANGAQMAVKNLTRIIGDD